MTSRENAARQRAADLLSCLGVDSPPVDPEWIAAQLGLEVQQRDLGEGVFAALWKDGDRFGIFVSGACPTYGHRRFSLAHELGHYYLDGHLEAMRAVNGDSPRDVARLARDADTAREREADWFASELLAPTAQVLRPVRRAGLSIETVVRFSREWQTSLTMTAIRCTELTTQLAATVRSHRGAVERVVLSHELRGADWAKSLVEGGPIPSGMATSSLAQDAKAVAAGETQRSRGMARGWFAGAPPSLEFEETAIGLGSYGRVLTLLVGNEESSIGQPSHGS